MQNRPIHLLVLVLLSVWIATGSAQAQNANALLAGVVDVRAYGAKGNGNTDDTAAIQKGLNAAPAGGTVVFPVEHYRVTAELVIGKPWMPCRPCSESREKTPGVPPIVGHFPTVERSA